MIIIIEMANVWYELEIMALEPDNISFYPIALYNRSDANAGFDIHASASMTIGQTPQLIPFGIVCRLLKVEPMPHGASNEYLKTDSHFLLMPRSSIFKTGLLMANSAGVIDKSYRGELKAPVWSMTGNSTVSHGDRLFQIVAPDMGWIRHVRMVDSLPETDRGAGGFGSTGK
jgi:deoxyuridine 5'-triphosphate nucleotidohydrolase